VSFRECGDVHPVHRWTSLPPGRLRRDRRGSGAWVFAAREGMGRAPLTRRVPVDAPWSVLRHTTCDSERPTRQIVPRGPTKPVVTSRHRNGDDSGETTSMRLLARAVGACLVLTTLTTACGHDLPATGGQGTPSCTRPSLTVVGHPQERGRLSVRAGQSLHLRGVHYTDCAAGGTGAGNPIAELQIILRSKYRIGPVATVHPRGENAAFTARVTIPATTSPGQAMLTDVLSPPHGVVRLVVRR
ncbi:MAG: hypothetical protein QOH37_672, partial [Nocardioidaceae bacterium]|nr:hypothetical protein [Nocardioidaceae bacterium]